jgi:hypothetical protein
VDGAANRAFRSDAKFPRPPMTKAAPSSSIIHD